MNMPNTTTIHAVGLEMERTYDAFERAKAQFAQAIYDAGNHDWESFWAVMKQILAPENRAWEGRINFSEKAAKVLFGRVDRSAQS